MPTLSPRLPGLPYLCKCIPFMCYTLFLSFLFLGVGFRFNLPSFWGCLRLVSHALVCFIGSFKLFKTRSSRFFVYPLFELLEIQWMNQHGFFSSCCHIGVCVIFEEVIQVNERFLHALRGLWQMSSLFFRRNPFMPHMLPIPIIHWTIF